MTHTTSSSPLGIVPALDLQTVDALERVVEATCQVEGIVEYKLGAHAVLHIGLFQAVAAIRAITDIPVIYDHQKAGADMPDSARGFVEICAGSGISGLILFPVAGPTAVHQFVSHSVSAGLKPVVGGHIPVPDYAVSGGGFMADDSLDRIIALAAESGARAFVLPANEPDSIRRRAAWMLEHVTGPELYVTGIGPLGGSLVDSFAAAEGVAIHRAVIGRRICAAPDPGEAARSLVEEMMQFA